MGVEPNQQDIPADFSDLPYEIQEVYYMFNLLPSRIAEFSGVYLGKDLGQLGFFFDIYEVDESWHKFYLNILLMIDSAVIDVNNKKRAAKEAASKAK